MVEVVTCLPQISLVFRARWFAAMTFGRVPSLSHLFIFRRRRRCVDIPFGIFRMGTSVDGDESYCLVYQSMVMLLTMSI